MLSGCVWHVMLYRNSDGWEQARACPGFTGHVYVAREKA